MTTSRLIPLALAVCLGGVALAAVQEQAPPPGRTLAVEHAVPFGQVPGKLILYGDYLVFVDEGQPGDSFVVARGDIENLSTDGPTVTVNLRRPARNRSGEVRRLSFRVSGDGDPGAVAGWYGSGAAARTAPAPAGSAPAAPEGAKVYQAQHNHRIGSCSGRLILANDMVSYESTDDIGHSRRWPLKDIREISLPNPYEINIRPFAGGNYKLRLEGSGMNPATYKGLVDRIAAARALK